MFLGYLWHLLYWDPPTLPHVIMHSSCALSIAEYSIALPEYSPPLQSITTVDKHVNRFHALDVMNIAAINLLRYMSCTSAKFLFVSILSNSSH